MKREWSITASDNTGFKLESGSGIISLYDRVGNMICEFMEEDISCEPEYLGENAAIECRYGRCECGNIVHSYQNYCDACGSSLAWGNVWG